MDKLQLSGRRDMRPLLFRLGVALALSLAGYLQFRPRRPPPGPSTGRNIAPVPAATAGLRDELHILTHEEALSRIINGSSMMTTTTTFMDLSPSCKSSGDDVGFLLPEFSQVVLKEFEASEQDPETTAATPTKLESEERAVMEQEISYLRNLVDSLRERERTLEIQLLGYHGLREQEAAVKELENRLKINATEAKLFSLKVEALQRENQRLQAQVTNYSNVVTELESARAMIRLLKRKLRSDGEQAEEKISAIQQTLAMLQDKLHEELRDNAEVEENLKRLKDLEDEVMDLRNVKSRLTQENFELKLKLRSMQMPTSSVSKVPEVELLEETNRLRDENEKLKKDIEQLHTDRCTDVEELVYLRWINACLRYELRNYQPPPDKQIARDLSKSLSPQSERKAKQLIVEYASFDIDERNTSFLDFDSDYCFSQASNEEPSDTSIAVRSTIKTSSSRKSKFISKLKKLVLGKDHHNQKGSSVDRTPKSCDNSERRGSVSPCSFDGAIRRGSSDSFSSCSSVELALANQSTGLESHVNERQQYKGSRPPRSLDIHRPRRSNLEETKGDLSEHCKSDVGTSCSYQSLLSGDDSSIDLSLNSLLDRVDIDVSEKVELMKLAKALRISCGSPKLKKRAASFSFT